MKAKKTIYDRRSDLVRNLIKYKVIRAQKHEKLKEIATKQRESIAKVSYKIKHWSREIRRIDEKLETLKGYNDKVRKHYGLTVYKVATLKQKAKRSLLMKMFAKYAIDHGVNGWIVSDFIGWKDRNQAGYSRRELGRLFKTDDKALKAWTIFKKVLTT